jgi:DNA helicase II / ATP-dependent DNA helicase PcrA
MAATLILAVAGSGKTSRLVSQLDADRQALVITYTDNNYATIRKKIRDRFGGIPEKITILKYFQFLYGHGVKPFLYLRERPKGINWDQAPIARGRARYFDGGNRMYHGRIAMYLEEQGVLSDMKARLKKYFDAILIDEVQDFGGRDFDFLLKLLDAGPKITLIGDFYQHTYTTSHDGNVNKNLHKTLNGYKAQFEKAGVNIEQALLDKSYRCSPTTCAFVRDRLGICIESHRTDATQVTLIDDKAHADVLFKDDHIIKLFFQESVRYGCRADNWGNVKGVDDYEDVCVVLNKKTFEAYRNDKLVELPPITRNRLYVAITRARRNVYFVPESIYVEYKRA